MPIPLALPRCSVRLSEPGLLRPPPFFAQKLPMEQWDSRTLWVVPNWAGIAATSPLGPWLMRLLPVAQGEMARPWTPRKGSYSIHTKLNLRKDPHQTTTKLPERQKVTVSL